MPADPIRRPTWAAAGKCSPTSPGPFRHATPGVPGDLGQLATLVARLTPAQQRLVVALADGFRGGWLQPLQWERAWRGSDLNDAGVLGDARTWLARRPG